MKLTDGLYQFTAVDDCTRLRVLGLYPNRTGASAAHFFEQRVIKELPFAIARVQTDRGSEFISHKFIGTLRRIRVKLHPNRPAAPHLNGKVERSQQTDLVEFYALAIAGKGKKCHVLCLEGLSDRLAAWQGFYNRDRAHSSLGGRTPWQRWEEVEALTPSRMELDGLYDPSCEPRSIKRGKWRWVSTKK
jgi:transposase InsO family protein